MNWDQSKQIISTLDNIGRELGGISNQLERIADSLETTDKKAKEQMVNKIKKALEE